MTQHQDTLARLLVATSWMWLTAAALAALYLTISPAAFSGVRLPVCVVLLLLLWQRPARVWLFRTRLMHLSFPPALATLLGAWLSGSGHSDARTALWSVAAAGGAAALSALTWHASPVPAEDPDADPNFVRGTRRERVERIRERAEAATTVGEATLTFGPLELALSSAFSNVIALGAPGSGKTLLLYLALKSIAPRVVPGSSQRVLIYDAKTETVSRLRELGFSGEVVITNFADARCAAWHLGADFREPHTIAEAAELLFPVPESGHPQVFFDHAVRDLVQGVMLSWNTRFPGCLTLRDLIVSMESETRLRHVLEWDPEANYARLQLYFAQKDTLQNILATIASKLEPYRAIAAFWHHAPHGFSLTAWLKGSSVLVVGRPIEAQTAADRLNSLLLARLTQLLLQPENVDQPHTYVFLDEVSKAGKLRHLDMLLLQGRSKGVRVWLGAQSVSSLRATYGKDVASDLLAGCGNIAVLALAEPDSAQWAEEAFGRHERWERSSGHSSTHGPQGVSYTSSRHWSLSLKPAILASEFLSLRPPSKRTREPLAGFFRVPGLGTFGASIDLDRLQSSLPDTGARGSGPGAHFDFVAAPQHHGMLRRYSHEELDILGLPKDDAGLNSPETEQESVGRRTRRPRPEPREDSTTLDEIPDLFAKKPKKAR